MLKIPVVVVDDEKLDRRIAKRRLADVEDFGEVLEAPTGDAFLEKFFDKPDTCEHVDTVPLILMDVNMPGRDGFETIEEMQERMRQGRGLKAATVMMFTSSANPKDRARAEALSSVKGYITKPMDANAVAIILEMYKAK